MGWIKRLFTDYIAGVLLVITPVIVGLLVWVGKQPLYIILSVIIFAFAMTFLGINQFHAFRERRKKGIASLNDQEIENTIRNWLDAPYLRVERKVDPDIFFQFDVTGKPGVPVTVKRHKIEPYLLNLGVQITWDDKVKFKLRNLRKPLRSNLISGLKIEMLRLGIQFVMSEQPFDKILLIEQIPLDDSLSRFYFLQRIFFVVRAASLVGEIITSTLIENSSSELTPDKEDSQLE